jgi:hypothetical protein
VFVALFVIESPPLAANAAAIRLLSRSAQRDVSVADRCVVRA